MKIVVAGFTTALLVFVVASAISEMLFTSAANSSPEVAPRRKSSRSSASGESGRSLPKSAKTQKASNAVPPPTDPERNEVQRLLSEVRLRELAVQAKEDAEQIVFEDIRDVRQSMDRMKQEFSEEMAAFENAANQMARRDPRRPFDQPTNATASRSVASRPTTKPVIALGGSQGVHDRAVLVKRFAKDGKIREARLLIRSLNDREAAKVLAEISLADTQLAEGLSEDRLVTRDTELNRR